MRDVPSVFHEEGPDAHGPPWTPAEHYGRLVEAAGVEPVDSQPCKLLQARSFWC